MTTREDIIDRLRLATSRVRGPERSALVAEAVTWADEIGDDQLCVDTRLRLQADYAWGGEVWKGLAPFVWCLARQSERPDLFDEQRLHTLRWNYKWAVSAAAHNPAVPVEQVRALEDGMEAFYREQGASMHGVHGERYWVARSLGQDAEALAELAAWRATPRDENSDCEACDPGHEVDAAAREDDWDRVVSTAVPVLRGVLSCDQQPANMQSSALLALLATGRPRAAWDAHVRAYRFHRTAPRHAAVDRHLEYLALSGHVERGLTILRRHASWTGLAQSALNLTDLLVGMCLVLREAVRAGRGGETLGVELVEHPVWCPGRHVDATATLAEAHEQVLAWVHTLTGAFDRRNGTTGVTDTVEHRLAREPFVADDGATLRVELLEEPEALPEIPTDALGGGQGEGDAAAVDADASPHVTGASASVPPDHPVDDVPVAAYPAVEPPVLRPPADLAEAVARLSAIGPGGGFERSFLCDQLRSRHLLDEAAAPDSGDVGGSAAGASGSGGAAGSPIDPVDLAMAAASLAAQEDRYEDAVEHRRKARALLSARLGEHPDLRGRLRLLGIDLDGLGDEVDADDAAGRPLAGEDGERLVRLDRTRAELAEVIDLLGANPPEEDLLLACADLMKAERVLLRCDRSDEAADALGSVRVLVERLERAGAEVAPAARDGLDLFECTLLAVRGEIYRSCALADSVLRRHDPCPAPLATAAHVHIGRVSHQYHLPEEAVVHFQEAVNIALAAGCQAQSVELLDFLARALGSCGRALEAAEVLETALSVAEGSGLDALDLRRTLVLVLTDLEEYQGLRETAVACAEAELARGWTGAAGFHLERAGDAAQSLHDPLGAAALYRRCAELQDAPDDSTRLRRARFLRRVGRSLTSHAAVTTNRGYMDEAMAEFARAASILATIPDQDGYSAAWEGAAQDEEVAYALWRCDEPGAALERCESAVAGYLEGEDPEGAASMHEVRARIHARLAAGDPAEIGLARECCREARALLAHPRWQSSRVLASVAQVEEYLESLT